MEKNHFLLLKIFQNTESAQLLFLARARRRDNKYMPVITFRPGLAR